MRCEGLRSHCTSIPHIAFALLCRAMPLPCHSLHCLSSARHFFSSAIQFNTKPCLCTSNSAVPLPRIALPCFAAATPRWTMPLPCNSRLIHCLSSSFPSFARPMPCRANPKLYYATPLLCISVHCIALPSF